MLFGQEDRVLADIGFIRFLIKQAKEVMSHIVDENINPDITSMISKMSDAISIDIDELDRIFEQNLKEDHKEDNAI